MITSRSDSIHSREHPCANHDNVQIRLLPFPQCIHVPTIPQNTGFFTTVTLPNMLKTLKAKTAVITTIFLLQHGHMSILSQKTQGFRILSQARRARERDDGAFVCK